MRTSLLLLLLSSLPALGQYAEPKPWGPETAPLATQEIDYSIGKPFS